MVEPEQIEALETLTPKQREMLRLVYQHMQSKQIARVLGCSPYTVDEYLRAALRKLHVSTRVEAARLLAEHELALKAAEDAPQSPPQPSTYQSSGVVLAPAGAPASLPREADLSVHERGEIHDGGSGLRQSGLAGDHVETAGDPASRSGGDAGAGNHGATPGRWFAPAGGLFDAPWRAAGSVDHHLGGDRPVGRGETLAFLVVTRLSMVLGLALVLGLLVSGAFAAVVSLVSALQAQIHSVK